MLKSLPKLFPLALATLLCTSCSQENSPANPSSSSEKHLRIATSEEPLSFDPRLVRDLPSATSMRMLYEGLTRTNAQGKIEPAAAESITISDDQKTYTFTLRESQWSDGTPVQAKDFEETWKTILTPDFPAPNAYQLYLIKGAKDAKEGRLSVQNIGVKATAPNTLVVELEQPTPYFLEMTSCHFYFPVHNHIRAKSQSSASIDKPISNGPFAFSHKLQRNEFSVVKNPLYWDKDAIKIDRITLQVLDENTALQLFKAGSIDWAGSPLSTLPQDAVSSLKANGSLNITPGGGTHWFRFNILTPPFTNKKMRRAFALALDRKAIVDHVTQGNQLPAIGIVPPSLGIKQQNYFTDHDVAQAKTLFQEALADMGITKEQLPKITLQYAANDRNNKIVQAVQQQWNKALGINVALESSEVQVLLDKLRKGGYQIALGSWYADIQDPINFLEIFKSKDNPTNQTHWQDVNYSAMIEKSSTESDPTQRLQQLSQAERILIEAMPVAPLFHSAYNYLKNSGIQGVYFSSLGYLDFKEAQLNEK